MTSVRDAFGRALHWSLDPRPPAHYPLGDRRHVPLPACPRPKGMKVQRPGVEQPVRLDCGPRPAQGKGEPSIHAPRHPEREASILAMLQRQPMASAEVAKEMGVGVEGARYHLRRMQRSGQIRAEGGGKRSVWRPA